MSRELGQRALEHVVFERGELANAWRTERWDGLRLLTPNWLCRLPGWHYQGDDPDGYMSAGEVADFVSRYAQALSAPVFTRTTVTRVEPHRAGYRVITDRGEWLCRRRGAGRRCVQHTLLFRPIADGVPRGVQQLSAQSYRNPAQLAEGGVLVIGASAAARLADHEHASLGHVLGRAVFEGRDGGHARRHPVGDHRGGSAGCWCRSRARPRPR